MQLYRAIEATALAGIKEERIEIKKECRFWSSQIPLEELQDDIHELIRDRLNQITIRARVLDAILKGE